MSFNSGDLVSSATARIRLMIGDISEEFPILEDAVYTYLLYENGSDERATAIQALENIINYYALNPTDEVFGAVGSSSFSISAMEDRLSKLKTNINVDKSGITKVPLILKSDRKGWEDFDKIF